MSGSCGVGAGSLSSSSWATLDLSGPYGLADRSDCSSSYQQHKENCSKSRNNNPTSLRSNFEFRTWLANTVSYIRYCYNKAKDNNCNDSSEEPR